MSVCEGVPGRRLLLIKIFAEFGYEDPVQLAKEADAWIWDDEPTFEIGDPAEGHWPVPASKESDESTDLTAKIKVTSQPGALAPWGRVQADIIAVLQGASKPMTSKDLRVALPQHHDQSIFNALRNAALAGRIIRERQKGSRFKYRALTRDDVSTDDVPTETDPLPDPVDSESPETESGEPNQASTDPNAMPIHEWTPKTRAEALSLVNEGYSNIEVAREMSRRLEEDVSVFKVAAILPKQKAKESTISRNCLKCQRAFKTDSKYIRMCDSCRKSASDFGML